MDDLLQDFLDETNEGLEKLDVQMVTLEQNPNNPELLGSIFRIVHTIKGTCGFLGLGRLEQVAHASENVLGKFRDGALDVTPKAVSLILKSLDAIKQILAALAASGEEPAGNDEALIAELNTMADGKSDESGGEGEGEANGVELSEPESEAIAEQPEVSIEATEAAAATSSPKHERELFEGEMSEDELAALFDSPVPPSATAVSQPLQDVIAAITTTPAPSPEVKLEVKTESVSAKSATEDTAAQSGNGAAGGGQTIRVSLDLLESLMTTVSELVLTRNQLLQIAKKSSDEQFTSPLQRLNQIVAELQDDVMKTRMQPVSNAWGKLPRIIRDISQELGKKIQLDMFGAETELDRQVLELIKDPLTHMVRNSADHGIETPDIRTANGKGETGHIVLKAYHKGGHIIIKISDDGKGLSTDNIRRKAIKNGLITEAEAESLSEKQLQQFIFRAGFSTAEKVTSVSGRGVGMDVVRTNIEKIGGTIELHSVEGKGTTFTIKIPLTLAIISALIVECDGDRFAIPQLSIMELVRLTPKSVQKIETIDGTPILRLRDNLLPIVSLRKILGFSDMGMNPHEQFIVVTRVGSYSFGIIVDQIFDTEEIVVKPVSKFLQKIPVYTGNTILGDGTVIMILDANGIASISGNSELADKNAMMNENAIKTFLKNTTNLLIFKAGDGAPKAVPLALVARLETFNVEDFEWAGNRTMIQYRNHLMPLIPCDQGHIVPKSGYQSVLVFIDRGKAMGLMVDKIIDIIEEEVKLEVESNNSGILGSAVISGKAMEVMDVNHYLVKVYPNWFEAEYKYEQKAITKRILVVDDSPFFRNMLEPLLKVAGYQVVTAASGSSALKICDHSDPFDLVISDIEMPEMDGFSFAQKFREDNRWQKVPVIALSAHVTPENISKSQACGFSNYVKKFDRTSLLSTIATTLDTPKNNAA